jgi:GTP-binding nuclear protein Ran
MEPQLFNRYKVLLIGDSKVGKTSYVNYLLTNKITDNYKPTLGVDVHPYIFNTNYGLIIFDIWDCAGDYKYRGIGSGYYIRSHGAIIMYTDENNNCTHWEDEIKSVCNNIPIILYNNININIKDPILLLAKKITGIDDLYLC